MTNEYIVQRVKDLRRSPDIQSAWYEIVDGEPHIFVKSEDPFRSSTLSTIDVTAVEQAEHATQSLVKQVRNRLKI